MANKKNTRETGEYGSYWTTEDEVKLISKLPKSYAEAMIKNRVRWGKLDKRVVLNAAKERIKKH